MRTNPKPWSDEVDVVDDIEFTFFFDDDVEDNCVDDAYLKVDVQQLTPSQRLEKHRDERQLRADLGDFDWDEYPAAH